MSNNVYWVLELAIKPGELDNFKGLMTEMVQATQTNEPSTLNYEWAIGEDNKSCHIYERYADSGATMTHLGAFGEKFAERFMANVEVTRFVVYGNPTGEVKEALSGFGAVFMSPIGGFAR
ncbi:MAG: putative quinol monooxygenase [bacterium]